MGTWGTAIFSDDLAADIRSDFKERIGDGLTSEEATEAIIRANRDSIDDFDDGPPFWLALASTQWSLGRFMPMVRDRALKIIDSGEDLRRREEDPSLLKKRREVLEKLRLKLESPPPPPKRVPKVFHDSNDWPVGVIVAYTLTDGRFAILRVTGHFRQAGSVSPTVEVLDWIDESLPSDKELKRLRVLGASTRVVPRTLTIGAISRREFPHHRVRLTGQTTRPSERNDNGMITLWRGLDRRLAERYGIGTVPDETKPK